MSASTDTQPSRDHASAWDAAPGEPHPAMPDNELVGWAARRISLPREAAADSFILHAPLELAARAALLPFVRTADRDLARVRLLTLTRGYEAWEPAGQNAEGERTFASIDAAGAWLVEGLARGELDDVDVAAAWLGRHASALELRTVIAGPILPHLGAAAHASIFLYQLARLARHGQVTGELLRPLARELARSPGWRLHWMESTERPPTGPRAAAVTPADVFDAVAGTPNDPELTASFIYPIMAHVDTRGIAAGRLEPLRCVAPADRAEAGRALLRLAAWAMLIEGDEAAPYGWSHCLTLPQAVLGLAPWMPDPLSALQVAGTYVVGFRSAQGNRPIDTAPPDEPGVPWRDALEAERPIAAAAAWHAPEADRAELVATLASRASIQHDAHLVKYTLACLDAVHDDPEHASLFLAAAASLGAYWHAHGNPDDPLV